MKLIKMQRFQANVDESSSMDPLNDALSEQNLTPDYCDDQTELIDSKENLRTLCEDEKFNINYICDVGQQSITGACDHNKKLNELDSKITQCIDQNTETHFKLDGFRRTLGLLLRKIGMEDCLPYDDSEVNDAGGEDDFHASSGISSKFDVIDSKISKCILANKVTHSKIDNLQKLMDFILKNIEVDSETSGEHIMCNDEGEVFRFPISTVNEINKLDEELQHNEGLMSDLVAKFTKIAGDSGNKSARKVGVKIIERIISAKLLTKFTWTGRSNGTNNIKLPFITYSSIFYLCLQVISKADRSFDTIACENFLKNNILKHSSMRLSRKFNKKVKRSKVNEDTWCRKPKLIMNGSIMKPQSKLRCLQPNETAKSGIEEDAFAEEMIDSKTNIKIIKLPDVQTETNNDAEVEDQSNHSLVQNSCLRKCDHESKLDIMDSKISECIESNTLVHSKIDTMQETLNVILSKIGKCQSFARNTASTSTPTPTATAPEVIDDELELFYFPITSVSGLQDLNRQLSKSEHFETKMINKFISIAGNDKKMSTQRFGLEVVESVISPQLLMKYSWTGRSKSVKPKFAFMKYQYIVNFFQSVISKVDKCFTHKECEDFLRFTVFKYINMRVARNRRKIKEQMSEYLSDQDQDVNQESNATSLSIEDVAMENPENGESYEYEHNSAFELSEAYTES